MTINRHTRRRIFKRDRWICQLCHEETDSSDPNGPMGPSVDHITPRAAGGSDEDTNLQTAHRKCNTAKGKRSSPDDPTWASRHTRYTWHADKDQLRLLRRHAKARGESLSAVINRAINELLSRET